MNPAGSTGQKGDPHVPLVEVGCWARRRFVEAPMIDPQAARSEIVLLIRESSGAEEAWLQARSRLEKTQRARFEPGLGRRDLAAGRVTGSCALLPSDIHVAPQDLVHSRLIAGPLAL